MGFPAKPEKQEKRRSATVTADLSSFEIPFTCRGVCQNGFLSASLKSSCTLTQLIWFWTFDIENHAHLIKRIGTSERKPELWLCIKRYGRSMEQEKASQRDKVLPRLEIHSVYPNSSLCTTEGSTPSIQSRPCPGPSKTLVIAAVSKSLKLVGVLQVANQKSYARSHQQTLRHSSWKSPC